MPLIQKKRIWWEPVNGAVTYVVYVDPESGTIDPAKFSWRDMPGMISKRVAGYTELVLPDEWAEFPAKPGTYHIAVTARDDTGNESDPLVLTGLFNFVAPAAPSKGGVDDFPSAEQEPEMLDRHPGPQGQSLISKGIEEVKNSAGLGEAYLGRGSKHVIADVGKAGVR
jgi:hypothetical protein